MSTAQRVLLINPTITSHRNARFPLAVMSLSAALEGKYAPVIIDGNVDRDFIATAVTRRDRDRHAAVGVTVMGGPQLLLRDRRIEGDPRSTAGAAHHLGRRLPDRLPGSRPEHRLRRLRRARAGRGHVSSSCWTSLAARTRSWRSIAGLSWRTGGSCTTRTGSSPRRASPGCCPTRSWRTRSNI